MVGVPSFLRWASPTNTLTLCPNFNLFSIGIKINPSTAEDKNPIIIAKTALVNNNILFTPFLLQYYIIVLSLLCNFYYFIQNFTFLLFLVKSLPFDCFVLITVVAVLLFFVTLLLWLSYCLIIYLNFLITLYTLVSHLYSL